MVAEVLIPPHPSTGPAAEAFLGWAAEDAELSNCILRSAFYSDHPTHTFVDELPWQESTGSFGIGASAVIREADYVRSYGFANLLGQRRILQNSRYVSIKYACDYTAAIEIEVNF